MLQDVQITAYLVASSLYRVYFHPLSKFPGPKASAFTRIPYLRAQLSGKLPHYIKELHDQYNSNVVRISPDDLSFIEPSAWNDMLMFHRGRETFQKDVIIYGNPPQGVHAVLTANDVDHARMRRILAHAFSEKALKMQEPLIQSHVDILMEQLKQDSIKSGGKVDVEAWFRWTTFDIMGELAFGESIDCLRSERHRQWSSMIFDLSKALVYMSASRRYPWSEKILRYFLPKQLMRRTANNAKLISELVDRRLKGGNEKQDFCSYILKYNDEKGMTVPEIKANASLFMAAGTDSSATILTGCIYFLSQHPDALRRLTDEIRNAFKTQEDIVFANTPKLSYLQAVLDETTRMYPPTLAGQPHRVPKGGANISGYWVPSGVRFLSSSNTVTNAFRSLSKSINGQPTSPAKTLSSRTLSSPSVGSATIAFLAIEKISTSHFRLVHITALVERKLFHANP